MQWSVENAMVQYTCTDLYVIPTVDTDTEYYPSAGRQTQEDVTD